MTYTEPGIRTPIVFMRAPDGEPQFPEVSISASLHLEFSVLRNKSLLSDIILEIERGETWESDGDGEKRRPDRRPSGVAFVRAVERTGCNPEREPPPRATIGTCARRNKRGTLDPCAPQPPSFPLSAQPLLTPSSPHPLATEPMDGRGVKGDVQNSMFVCLSASCGNSNTRSRTPSTPIRAQWRNQTLEPNGAVPAPHEEGNVTSRTGVSAHPVSTNKCTFGDIDCFNWACWPRGKRGREPTQPNVAVELCSAW